MKVLITKEFPVNVNPMKGVTGSVYEGSRGGWWWHLVLPKECPELVKGATKDPSAGYWYSGNAETQADARRGLAKMAGKVYAAMLIHRKFLRKVTSDDIEF